MRVLAALLVSLGLTGCLVSPPDLGSTTYTCATSQDCVDGWTCADVSVVGPDMCAPRCDPNDAARTCPDGFCDAQGACLSTCSIASDGSLDRACRAGLTCVRRNGLTGEGLCLPAQGCSVSSECASTPHTDCANEVFGLPSSDPLSSFSANHSFCIATPEGEQQDRCPNGLFAATNATRPICIPSCDHDADRCPPGFACLRGLGGTFGAGGRNPCWIGLPGVPCRDDSECLEGRCRGLADGRHVCTYTCEQALAATPEGCAALDGPPIGGLGGLDFTCDAAGMCAPRGAVGAPCNADMPCVDGLTCFGGSFSVCTTTCTTDVSCQVPGVSSPTLRHQVYCRAVSNPSGQQINFCFAQQPTGAPCTTRNQCVSGRCVAGVCALPVTP